MNIEKIFGLLGIAQKGRNLMIGKTAVIILIKRKKASLVILASDASEKLKHEIEFECRKLNVPMIIFSNKDELGKVCDRDMVAVLGVADKNLADGIKKQI